MLTLPVVHPTLMALLTNAPLEQQSLEAVPPETWAAIIEDAIAQRVAPILYQWLTHSMPQLQIPSPLHQRLHQRIIQLAAWNLALTDELLRILRACQAHNIECIPIRGPVLAACLYGADAIRQMDDLDLLVHQEDLSAVKTLFDRLGYEPQEPRQGFLETFSYSLEFAHPQHGVLVEPRWTLAYPPFLATAAMGPVWARSRRCRLRDSEIDTLSSADLLLHLCLHLLHKGRHAPLLWYYEADRLIRNAHEAPDWHVVADQARMMGQSGLIAEVLRTLAHYFHSPIPETVLTGLGDPSESTVSPAARRVHARLLMHPSLNGREEFALLCSLPGLLQKLRYALALLLPSPRYMTQRYSLSHPIYLPGAYLGRAYRLLEDGYRWTAAWITAALTTRRD